MEEKSREEEMKKTWQIGIAAAAAGGAGWTMVYFFFNQGLYQPFLWQGTAVLFSV